MSKDIQEQVVADIKGSRVKMLLQVNKSINVSNCGQLIAIVGNVKNKEVESLFFFCQSLKTTLPAKNKLDMIVYKTTTSHSRNWFDMH